MISSFSTELLVLHEIQAMLWHSFSSQSAKLYQLTITQVFDYVFRSNFIKYSFCLIFSMNNLMDTPKKRNSVGKKYLWYLMMKLDQIQIYTLKKQKKSPPIIKSKKAFFLRLCSNFIEFHSFVFVVSLFAIN